MGSGCVGSWPLHDIAITNIIWHILQLRGVGVYNILRNSVGDEGRWGGCPYKGAV